jgi:hypothetical protein
MPDVPALIAEIETRLRESRVSVAVVCRKAGVDRSAWHRWKAGQVTPRAAAWGRVRDVLQPIIGPVPDAAGAPNREAA